MKFIISSKQKKKKISFETDLHFSIGGPFSHTQINAETSATAFFEVNEKIETIIFQEGTLFIDLLYNDPVEKIAESLIEAGIEVTIEKCK
jgi:hypothetical protein